MIERAGIEQRWKADGSKRDERGRRVFAASEARAAGRGGLAAVSQITGLARSTIGRGLEDLDGPPPPGRRVRREGGGPRSLTDRDASLLADLERLVEPATRGDPERALLWVSKSCDKLASALEPLGRVPLLSRLGAQILLEAVRDPAAAPSSPEARRRTGSRRRLSIRGSCGATCSTGSAWSRSSSRRCGNGRRTSRC